MLSDSKLKAAILYNTSRGLPGGLTGATFARLVNSGQLTAGLEPDGKLGPASLSEFSSPGARVPDGLDYAKIFAGGVHPMPICDGQKPLLTSGFIARSGRGPNKRRLERSGKPHYGADLLYKWDGQGEPPLGWKEHHFTARHEGLFYCPPVNVAAILDGEVEFAELMKVSKKWGGPRWTVRIYHGELPGFGHFSTWSTHHRELLVSKGDFVQAGEAIAICGETGSPGAPHNHQEGWRWQTGDKFTREQHALDLAPILPHLELRAA